MCVCVCVCVGVLSAQWCGNACVCEMCVCWCVDCGVSVGLVSSVERTTLSYSLCGCQSVCVCVCVCARVCVCMCVFHRGVRVVCTGLTVRVPVREPRDSVDRRVRRLLPTTRDQILTLGSPSDQPSSLGTQGSRVAPSLCPSLPPCGNHRRVRRLLDLDHVDSDSQTTSGSSKSLGSVQRLHVSLSLSLSLSLWFWTLHCQTKDRPQNASWIVPSPHMFNRAKRTGTRPPFMKSFCCRISRQIDFVGIF